MKEYIYEVAGCCFSVLLPAEWDVERLLPSFRVFEVREVQSSEFLFRLEIMDVPRFSLEETAEVIEESVNDMGYVRVLDAGKNLQIEISYDESHKRNHFLVVNRNFTEGKAFILYNENSAGIALTSMLRMLFAQTLIRHKGVSIHASCVTRNGKGYLFLGKSGTGKSTHSEQWMHAFSDCSLLNDDNPAIRLIGDEVRVYGTPWSGKKSCYKAESYPVRGIVRLYQSPGNQFIPVEDTLAFSTLLPSCSVFRDDMQLQNLLFDLLVEVVERVSIGILKCLPNKEAANLCYKSLSDV